MLSKDFFEVNDIFYEEQRIKSLEEFQNNCQEYTLSEHQFPPKHNVIHLSKVSVKNVESKIKITLTGKSNELRIGKHNLVNHGLTITYSAVFDGPPIDTIIEIGDHNFFNGKVYITSPVQSGRIIHIGSNNLFANRVLFMGRNDHGIFDKNTHEQLNTDQNIILGDRNWICKDAELYPKAQIANDCVIAAHAIVNHKFEENNLLIAGIPAIIKRKNIIWNYSCKKEQLEETLPNPLKNVPTY